MPATTFNLLALDERQVVAADRAGERGLELWPRHLPTCLARHALFKYTGRVDRAQAMLDTADTQPPLPPWLKATRHAVAKAIASGGSADRLAVGDALLGSLGAGGPLVAIGATMDLAALGAAHAGRQRQQHLAE